MKKWQKIIIIIIICFISFCYAYGLLSLANIADETRGNISLIFFILPIIIFFINRLILYMQNKSIMKTSLKIKEINKLNELYEFRKINQNNHNIKEREYSRKSLDRVLLANVVKYYIENNIDYLKDDIESAIYNIKLLEKYWHDVEKIVNSEYENKSKYTLKKYQKIEKRVLKAIIYKEADFFINIDIKVYYISRGGKVYDEKSGHASFERVVELYNECQKGQKFAQTIREERRIMNDDIRYNVLKRDNFTCRYCGATAKDGAKLHVDHIIPVSKGGKTVMSNLQTLCERCNMGKSNKTD